jgi:hypothetical protein
LKRKFLFTQFSFLLIFLLFFLFSCHRTSKSLVQIMSRIKSSKFKEHFLVTHSILLIYRLVFLYCCEITLTICDGKTSKMCFFKFNPYIVLKSVFRSNFNRTNDKNCQPNFSLLFSFLFLHFADWSLCRPSQKSALKNLQQLVELHFVLFHHHLREKFFKIFHVYLVLNYSI